MKKEAGYAACPECGDTQTVMHDGRKYYIKCASCGAFINYQSNAAKARIEAKLTPLVTGNPEPEPPDSGPETAQAEPKPDTLQKPKREKPYKPAFESERGFFGSYDDWY